MARQEVVQIVIVENGSRTVTRNITGIGRASRGVADDVFFLQRALATLGGAALLRGLLNTTDAFTNMQNRIRLVTNDVGELNAVSNELLAISNRTRTSLATNAELFNRIALATRELGLSQGRVLRILETLNKLVLISGASAKEANNGLIQLSQGLASGALRGDELRSVLEQLPAVADALALQLGVTRGQLRAVGADFKITSDVIVAAFENIETQTRDRFGKVVPTIEQAFQVLGNSVTFAIGKFNTAEGVTRRLSEALVAFASDVELVGKVALSGVLAAGILSVTASIKLLTAAIAANPMAALFVGLTSAISALVVFRNDILILGDGITSLGDFFEATFDRIKKSAKIVTDFFRKNFGIVGEVIAKAFGDADLSFVGFLRIAAKGLDLYVGAWRGAFLAIAGLFTEFFKGLKVLGIIILNFFEGIAKTIKAAATLDFDQAAIISKATQDAFINATNTVTKDLFGQNIGDAMAEGFEEGFKQVGTPFEDALNGILKDAESIGLDRRIAELLDVAGAQGFLREDLTKSLTDILSAAGNEGASVFLDSFQKGIEDDDLSFEELNKLQELLVVLGASGQQASDIINQLGHSLADSEVNLDEATIASAEGAKTGLPGLLGSQAAKDLIQETKLLQLGNRERTIQADKLKFIEQLRKDGARLTPEDEKLAEALLRANEELARRADILDQINGPQEEFNAKVSSLNVLLAQGKISTEQFTDKMREFKIEALDASTDFADGFERGIQKLNEGFDDMATQAETLVVDTFGGMKDALVDFVDTGKFSFTDLKDSILHDLAEIASSALMDDILGSLTGGKLGNQSDAGIGDVLGGFLSLFGGAQAGGPVTGSQPVVVGEKGPELFVPATSGNIVPNSQLPSGQSAPEITILNIMDPDEIHAALNTPKGEKLVVNIIQRQRQAVKGALA